MTLKLDEPPLQQRTVYQIGQLKLDVSKRSDLREQLRKLDTNGDGVIDEKKDAPELRPTTAPAGGVKSYEDVLKAVRSGAASQKADLQKASSWGVEYNALFNQLATSDPSKLGIMNPEVVKQYEARIRENIEQSLSAGKSLPGDKSRESLYSAMKQAGIAVSESDGERQLREALNDPKIREEFLKKIDTKKLAIVSAAADKSR